MTIVSNTPNTSNQPRGQQLDVDFGAPLPSAVNISAVATAAAQVSARGTGDRVEAEREGGEFAPTWSRVAGEAPETIRRLIEVDFELKAKLRALAPQPREVQARTKVQAMHQDLDPYAMWDKFVSDNPAQGMLDRLLRGDFPPEFLEGPAGQIHLMMIQDAMQARTNFMNMLSNIMKKNDEAASTAIGNMR